MKKSRFYIVLLGLTAILASCTTYREFSIEVFRPQEVNLPDNAKSGVLIYQNFKFPNDTLQHYYRSDGQLKKDRKNQHVNIDSLAAESCLQAAAEVFRSRKVLDETTVLPANLVERHRFDKIPRFQPDFVKKVADDTKANLLISLATFSFMFSEYPYTDQGASCEVITAGIWDIYDAKTGKLSEHKQMVDTIFWNTYNESTGKNDLKLPPRITAIEMAASLFGENYARRFTSNWESVNRMFILPPVNDFKLAAGFAENSEWDKAREIWERYTGDKLGKLAITARYNLALACEMQDDIDGALSWLSQALKLGIASRSTDEMQNILRYQKILQQRKKEIEKLSNVPADE